MSANALSMEKAKIQLADIGDELSILDIMSKSQHSEMLERLRAFGPYLATRLNRRLTPMGFIQQCSTAIDDLEKGHDAGQPIDNPLVGSSAAVIALLYHSIPVLAGIIFPEEFAAEVNQCFLRAVEKTKELRQEGR